MFSMVPSASKARWGQKPIWMKPLGRQASLQDSRRLFCNKAPEGERKRLAEPRIARKRLSLEVGILGI